MRRLLPHPLGSFAIALTWLALNGTLHPAHLVLAAVFGLALPPMLGALWPRITPPRRPGVALRLLAVLLKDIILANIEVARRILGPESAIHPRFLWVPLDLQDPQGVAVLAAMITMTPGTLSADVTPDRRFLLVHAFNVQDEAALRSQIKQRYESPLREIFEGSGA